MEWNKLKVKTMVDQLKTAPGDTGSTPVQSECTRQCVGPPRVIQCNNKMLCVVSHQCTGMLG